MKSNRKRISPKVVIAFRTKFKFSQKDLADLLGVTYQAVTFWEEGERKVPETTGRILKLFEKYPQLINEFKM